MYVGGRKLDFLKLSLESGKKIFKLLRGRKVGGKV